jgi:Ribbon-helix-helix protein, copG family
MTANLGLRPYEPKGKRGRPATGHDPMLGGRVPAEIIAAVDAYAAKGGTNRSDAMRRLLEAGLKRRPKV